MEKRNQPKVEIRDKKCPDCDKFIMRKSSHCRGCSQRGIRSAHYKYGGYKCGVCNKAKRHPGLCWNCYLKTALRIDELHPLFKVTGFGYVALHTWIRSRKGKPQYCSNNVSHKGIYVWANISGEYKRDINDFWSLCQSCNLKDGIRIPKKYHKELNIGSYAR